MIQRTADTCDRRPGVSLGRALGWALWGVLVLADLANAGVITQSISDGSNDDEVLVSIFGEEQFFSLRRDISDRLFDGFDTNLGTLTRVQFEVDQIARALGSGLAACEGEPCSFSAFTQLNQSARLLAGGVPLALLTSPTNSGGFGCGSGPAGICRTGRDLDNLLQASVEFTDPADLARFTQPVRVEPFANFTHVVLFANTSIGLVEFRDRFFSRLTLTYTFDEPGSPPSPDPIPGPDPVGSPVPEPSSLLLFAAGLPGLWFLWRRWRANSYC